MPPGNACSRTLSAVPRCKRWLLGLFVVLWIVSCIRPPYPDELVLQHIPTVLAVLLLVAVDAVQPLSRASYVAVLAFLCLHLLGARHLYTNVPYHEWFGILPGHGAGAFAEGQRNHYDRLVHFLYGLLLAGVAREFLQKATSMSDALVAGWGKLEGRQVNICAMELKFVGGSMGTVVGEVITRAIERSLEHRVPLIIVSASGGARMQEGAVSLMQLAKISAALMRLDDAKVPYISVLTDPTTGGVTASFAMLGDLNIAEPGALIGFAGPRVIEQTIRQKLPDGFQTSEFLLQHGFLDGVVKRAELKDYIGRAFDFFLV